MPQTWWAWIGGLISRSFEALPTDFNSMLCCLYSGKMLFASKVYWHVYNTKIFGKKWPLVWSTRVLFVMIKQDPSPRCYIAQLDFILFIFLDHGKDHQLLNLWKEVSEHFKKKKLNKSCCVRKSGQKIWIFSSRKICLAPTNHSSEEENAAYPVLQGRFKSGKTYLILGSSCTVSESKTPNIRRWYTVDTTLI